MQISFKIITSWLNTEKFSKYPRKFLLVTRQILFRFWAHGEYPSVVVYLISFLVIKKFFMLIF